MFRTILMLASGRLALPIAALVGIPWTYLTKDVSFLYRIACGPRGPACASPACACETVGLEKIDPSRNLHLHVEPHLES